MSDDPDRDYFARPLACPLCGRRAEGDAWPTHPEFGYRLCPACRNDGYGSVIPRLLSDEEMTEWEANNAGW